MDINILHKVSLVLAFVMSLLLSHAHSFVIFDRTASCVRQFGCSADLVGWITEVRSILELLKLLVSNVDSLTKQCRVLGSRYMHIFSWLKLFHELWRWEKEEYPSYENENGNEKIEIGQLPHESNFHEIGKFWTRISSSSQDKLNGSDFKLVAIRANNSEGVKLWVYVAPNVSEVWHSKSDQVSIQCCWLAGLLDFKCGHSSFLKSMPANSLTFESWVHFPSCSSSQSGLIDRIVAMEGKRLLPKW